MLLTRFITSISYFNFNNKSQFLLIPFATMASSTVDVAKSGFSRPEMYTEKLAGTVESYDRHVFLCYKNHQAWPPRVEASDDDPLPKRIATTWKARKNDIVVKVITNFLKFVVRFIQFWCYLSDLTIFFLFYCLQTKITVCEAREEDGFSDGDVLIFPEMIKYK